MAKKRFKPLKVILSDQKDYPHVGDGIYSPVAENVDASYAALFAAAPRLHSAAKIALARIEIEDEKEGRPSQEAVLLKEAIKAAENLDHLRAHKPNT